VPGSLEETVALHMMKVLMPMPIRVGAALSVATMAGPAAERRETKEEVLLLFALLLGNYRAFHVGVTGVVCTEIAVAWRGWKGSPL
jgi:hypothetical protein